MHRLHIKCGQISLSFPHTSTLQDMYAGDATKRQIAEASAIEKNIPGQTTD